MAKKTLYLDSICGYDVSVTAEHGKVTAFSFEKTDNDSIVGNVYKGKVVNVLPGMQAAFVDCGLDKNCYLSTEGLPESGKYQTRELTAPTLPALHEGDEILVQVTKAPVGKKGAKVTSQLSFIAHYLIYMPNTAFIGVSRKICDDELRENLIYAASKLKTEKEGLVLRTAAPYAKHNQLKIEYEYLKSLYKKIKATAENLPAGSLLYSDYSLPVRALRDTVFNDIAVVNIGAPELYKKISDLINLYPPRSRCPVVLHDSGRDMFEETGISEQISAATSPRAELSNGAYLVIEKTEALTAIDVNTGKFTGGDSLEQTVYHTNILAAREIARQVSLRNIGGLVVVDFIDMQEAEHRKAIVEELERSLKKDAAICSVAPMSQFGLVEFTRKRTSPSTTARIVKPCKYCGDTHHVKVAEYILLDLRAKLLKLVADGVKSVRVDMNAEVFQRLLNWRELTDDLHFKCGDMEIFVVPHRTYRDEQLSLRNEPEELPANAVKI